MPTLAQQSGIFMKIWAGFSMSQQAAMTPAQHDAAMNKAMTNANNAYYVAKQASKNFVSTVRLGR